VRRFHDRAAAALGSWQGLPFLSEVLAIHAVWDPTVSSPTGSFFHPATPRDAQGVVDDFGTSLDATGAVWAGTGNTDTAIRIDGAQVAIDSTAVSAATHFQARCCTGNARVSC
jgi:hypothetical protein